MSMPASRHQAAAVLERMTPPQLRAVLEQAGRSPSSSPAQMLAECAEVASLNPAKFAASITGLDSSGWLPGILARPQGKAARNVP